VSYDPATATLAVGARRVVVTCDPADNECLLRTYLELVAAQRGVVVGSSVHLRRDDVLALARLLDLDDDELESRLQRLLRLSENEASALARRLRRNAVAAALGLGIITAVPAIEGLATADRAVASPPPAAAVEQEATTSTTEPLPPTTVTVTVPAPVPAPETTAVEVSDPAPAPVDVGHAVRHERDPDFVAPPGVDIGDAMVIERDTPPAP
jgi:hypothetical protein